MIHGRTAGAAGALLALLLAGSGPDPDPVVITVGDRSFTRSQYADWLFRHRAHVHAQEFVDEVLVRAEAGRLGVRPDPAELDRLAAEARGAAVAARHGGDEARFRAAELAATGLSETTWQSLARHDIEMSRLHDAIARAARIVSDDTLRLRFEERYGPGGRRIDLSHILCRAEPVPIDPSGDPAARERAAAARFEAARRRAEAIRDRLTPANFEIIAAAESDDIPTRDKGGRIDVRFPGRFGPGAEEAISGLAEGAISAPVRGIAGWHIFLARRVVLTRIEDVREALREEILAEPRPFGETVETLRRLRAAARVTLSF